MAARRHRLTLRHNRDGTRDWQVKRRERTRQLIELGGLVAKAKLVDLTDDDRAVIFGALIEAAARLQGAEREQMLLLWRRRGRRAFDLDAAAPEVKHGDNHESLSYADESAAQLNS